ncbi:GntR family transcriptional regulator [Paenibacillus lactis]|uniref:GntR family transcriptional regulator n=1 Tax=Paenibacillus lactis TaxID=228574 RepID=UPI001B11CEB3|nr:GntR family transcriptional regulator [Paenibacillus lactis]GIO90126.1 phosphonate metabolism transcriptional regulator PhnF [Paenibacillus lactis]
MKEKKSVIDKNSVIPLYFQVKEYLRNEIATGHYIPEQLIPSERELAEEFEINRLTVRQAINELVQEGLLYRQRGVGTFVSQPKIEQPLTSLTSFSKDMENRGIVPGALVVSMKVIPATKQVASRLQMEADEEVLELVRVRTADGEPMALERSYLRYDQVKPLYGMDMENVSLYQKLEEVCGIRLVKAIQTIEVASVYPDEAGILEIGPHEPAMLIERITYTEGADKPLEFVRSLYRGDRYKFKIEMNL